MTAGHIVQRVADLWNGRVPMSRVFWEYAILFGSLLNLITTALALAAFSRGWHAAIGLTIHLLPIPYNLLMVVSVWRAAARYAGHAIWSTLTRALIIVWAVAAIIA